MERRAFRAVLGLGAILTAAFLSAETVQVRHSEGVVRGFLTLKTLQGAVLADGDLVQVADGDRVTSRMVFHFKDGSTHDETVVFTQRGRFRLVSDHLVQKGPTFPQPLDVVVDAPTGLVTVRTRDKKGMDRTFSKRLDLPEDVANGLILTLLKNVDSTGQAAVSMVAATPKPRLVKLAISSAGEDSFSIGSAPHKAVQYVVKVEIGGLAGLLAPLVGKQPPDTHVWILRGIAPAFVRSEGPLYFGGPVWRIELAMPSWPQRSASPGPPGSGRESGRDRASR